jgi:hypothetical protein
MANIGFCGAQRTGKTTLAIALSQTLKMPFVNIGTSNIFLANKLDPAKPMDFRTRLGIQREILDHADNIWFEMDQSFVCDRTPIDMAAYTLADVGGATLDKTLEQELEHYLTDCAMLTTRYFDYLFLVPPAIPIVDAIGKASPSRGYIEHIHMLCLGLFSNRHESISGAKIPVACLELGDRVKFVEDFWRG